MTLVEKVIEDPGRLVLGYDSVAKANRGFGVTDGVGGTVVEQKWEVHWPGVPGCTRVEELAAVDHVRGCLDGTEWFAERVILTLLDLFGIAGQVLPVSTAEF